MWTGDATPIQANDVIVLIGAGPMGTGMEETYQLTAALKYVPWGKTVPIVTDARFSGVSTGACIGHVGPEALAGGPIGKLRDGDVVEIVIDRGNLTGQVNLVGGRCERGARVARLRTRGWRRRRELPHRHAPLVAATESQRRNLGRLRLRLRAHPRGDRSGRRRPLARERRRRAK